MPNHLDSGGVNTRTSILSTAPAILVYQLTAAELAALQDGGSFSIGIRAMNSAGVFWSVDPRGLPGMDPSWRQEENVNQVTSDVVVLFNDRSKFDGRDTIYVFLDDEAMTGPVTALGQTISNK